MTLTRASHRRHPFLHPFCLLLRIAVGAAAACARTWYSVRVLNLGGHAELCRALGDIVISPIDKGFERALPGFPEVHVFGTAPSASGGEQLASGASMSMAASVQFSVERWRPLWHTDQSFQGERKAPALSALYCESAPETGGDTLFADCAAAYAALPAADRAALAASRCCHSLSALKARLAAFGGVVLQEGSGKGDAVSASSSQPLVRSDGGGRVPALYLNPLASVSVEGPAAGADDAAAACADRPPPLALRLASHATQRRFVHRHRWADGDLVVWDNRCTMHVPTPWAGRRERVVWRLTMHARRGPSNA